jgi:hypothetical protein
MAANSASGGVERGRSVAAKRYEQMFDGTKQVVSPGLEALHVQHLYVIGFPAWTGVRHLHDRCGAGVLSVPCISRRSRSRVWAQ